MSTSFYSCALVLGLSRSHINWKKKKKKNQRTTHIIYNNYMDNLLFLNPLLKRG